LLVVADCRQFVHDTVAGRQEPLDRARRKL